MTKKAAKFPDNMKPPPKAVYLVVCDCDVSEVCEDGRCWSFYDAPGDAVDGETPQRPALVYQPSGAVLLTFVPNEVKISKLRAKSGPTP